MLTFLKRIGHTSKYANGRLTNILICSMQLVAPLITMASLIMRIIQEQQFSLITKSFVALGFVVNIDDMFAASIPLDIKKNAERLNQGKKLKLTKDYNSFKEIFSRLSSKKNKVATEQKKAPDPTLIDEMINILINLWYQVIINLQLIIINYFAGMACVIFQIIGFYNTM